MTKIIVRVSAVLTALVLAITLLATLPALPARAAAGDKPVFTITTDQSSADTGSRIIVSVAVDNDTAHTITSFQGDLLFDTRFFRYEGFEDQLSMDGSVDVVSTASSTGKLSFVYVGKELTNSRINSGDSVVFIKFIFTVATNYDTTGQFFIGTINDCYFDDVNLGVIDCKAPNVAIRSTTAPVQTQPTTAQNNLSGDARLSSLVVEGCTLSPTFNSEFVAYSAVVPYETSSIRINAVTSSSGAIASGLGVKDLAVGINNYTVTVLAENGTIKEYGLVITRLEPTVPSESTTSTLPEATTAPSDPAGSTAPTETVATLPTTIPGNTVIEGDNDEVSDDVLQVVGIVFGEIALFFFGFLSGFFVDKNLRRKGERREDYDDDYDDYDEDDDYDQPVGTIYAPGDQMYSDGTYIDPSYQMQQQYAEPPLVDPQLLQYNQFMQQPVDQQQMINQQMGMGQPMNPQAGQYGEQPMYPDSSSYDGGYDNGYDDSNYSGPYYS